MDMKRTSGPGEKFLLALGLLCLAAAGLGAQSDEELFGEETVTEAAPAEAAPQDEFLKYDQVRVGGKVTGSLGFNASWIDPWSGGIDLIEPDDRSVDPSLEGKVTITAKPAADFGVNMDFRTSWPFSTSLVDANNDSFSLPDISVWALYSKFSWKDSLFFSFGKQPLSWGVSKSLFQPADDIFALTAVDIEDTDAEREGPIVFKAHYPIPLTMTNFYFYAGVPDSDEIDLEDIRLAAKAEFNTGNTELALGGYYAYDDHPRLLLMGSTGRGNLNFFGEAILKYGSERYFIEKNGTLPATWTGTQRDSDFFFTGTLGGYYTDDDGYLTISAAYLYNGEGQTEVDAEEAYSYYYLHSDEVDRMRFGTHYAYVMVSRSELFVEELTASLIGYASLTDLSGVLMPSLSWEFFDYATVKLGATITFGGEGDQFTFTAGGKPSLALNLTFTLGTGTF